MHNPESRRPDLVIVNKKKKKKKKKKEEKRTCLIDRPQNRIKSEKGDKSLDFARELKKR